MQLQKNVSIKLNVNDTFFALHIFSLLYALVL